MNKKLYAWFMVFLVVQMPFTFSLTINSNSIQVTNLDDDSATVSWTTDIESDGFVDYGPSINNLKSLPDTGGMSSYHSVDLTGLATGTKYYYKVRSTDGYTSSDESSFYEFTTLIGKPAGLAADSVTDSQISFHWDGIPAASGYRIFLDDNFLVETQQTSYTISDLDAGKEYMLYVRALDSDGRMSPASDALQFTTENEAVDISFIQVTDIKNTSVVISWKTSSQVPSVVRFDEDIKLDKQVSDPAPKTVHSLMIDQLKPSTRYYFQIDANGIVSDTSSFVTIDSGSESGIIISDVSSASAGDNSVRITWKTNIPSDSTVLYGETDELDQTEKSSQPVTDHSVTLVHLKTGTTYYYRVMSGQVTGDYNTFSVDGAAGSGSFLNLDKLPETTTSSSVEVSGTTSENARVYIFVNSKTTAQVRETITGTSFSFPVRLSSMASAKGIDGNNEIYVVSWDKDGVQDSETAYVVYDSHPPRLNVDAIPDKTNKHSIKITGTSEIGARIEFYVNGRQQSGIRELQEKKFEFDLGIGADGNNTIKIVAFDSVGNNATYTHLLVKDSKKPTIELDKEIAKAKETHFKLYRISGKTEPFATVEITNYGKYSGCEEAIKDLDYTTCDEFLDQYSAGYQLDPISYGLGMRRSTTADSDGRFEIIVSLLPDKDGKTGVNWLYINATDEAGNWYQHKFSVKYKPGCRDWQVGKLESYPFNIYMTDLAAGSVPGSAFFPIHYIGPGTPTVSDVSVGEDSAVSTVNPLSRGESVLTSDSNEWISLNLTNNNDLVSVGKPKASKFDATAQAVYVYVPINIDKYTGPADNLPDQLNTYLKVRINYQNEYGSSTCEVYPMVAFDIQKPEDVTDWLSPEQINKTIRALDEMINWTEDKVDFFRKASYAGLLLCGAMVVWEYVSGFMEDKTEAGPGECSDQQRSMEKVYYMCDRVLCPASPPECNKFEPLGKEFRFTTADGTLEYGDIEEYQGQLETNKNWQYEYNKAKRQGKTDARTSDAWINSLAPDERAEYAKKIGGEYRSIQPPTFASVHGEGQISVFEYYRVKNGQIVGVDNNINSYVDKDNGINVNVNVQTDQQYSSWAKACGDGTLVVSRYVEKKGAEKPGLLVSSREQTGLSYDCDPRTPEQLLSDPEYAKDGVPKTSNIAGCYNAECPQFDNTKCPRLFSFFDGEEGGGSGYADINPPEGLWSSLKCICLPGILKHLENYLKIMKGAKKCLQQALIGEVRGGFCKRLFAQFICDILIEAFKFILHSVNAEGGENMFGAGSREALTNYKENSAQISDSLSDRYGGVIKDRMGLSSDQLIHKACVFSITQDWSVLEGLLENYVDQVEIEPVATVFAESRPYGYDPFTGKMNIGYNIYIGIVPGGETNVQAWLECDKDADGGEFCGTSVPPFPVSGVPAYMTADDQPHNENHAILQKDALFWYNKVVLKLDYTVGGIAKQEIIEKKIWRKGGLAANCHFDIMSGIHCDAMSGFLNQEGVVELSAFGKDTRISPEGVVFSPGNPVSAFVRLRNQYKDDKFFLRIDYKDSGRQSIEYPIYGAGEMTGSEYQGIQYYDLWIDSIGKVDDSTGSYGNVPSQDDTKIISLSEFGRGEMEIGNNGEIEYSMINIKSATIDFVCTANVGGASKTFRKSVKYTSDDKGKDAWITADCIDADDASDAKLTMIKVYSPTRPAEGESSAAKIRIKDSRDTAGTGEQVQEFILLRSKSQSDTASGSGTTGSRSVEINVLVSSSGADYGDTPLLYDDGADQRTEGTYRFASKPLGSAPFVDFIEPVAEFFPAEGKVPIGFNIWDDADDIGEVRVEIKGAGIKNKDVSCIVKFDRSDDPYPENCDIFRVERSTRSQLFSSKKDAPPFLEFYLQFTTDDKDYKDSDAIYDVTVIATDNGRNQDQKKTSSAQKRRFSVVSGSEIRDDDLMVWLGGKSLSCEKCISYHETSVSVAKPDKSAITTGNY